MALSQQDLASHIDHIKWAVGKNLSEAWDVRPEDVIQPRGGTATVILSPPYAAAFKFYPDQPRIVADMHRAVKIQSMAHDAGLPVPRVLMPLEAWDNHHSFFYTEQQIGGQTLSEFLRGERPEAQVMQAGRQVGRFIADFDDKFGALKSLATGSETGIGEQDEPTRAAIQRLEEPLRSRIGAHFEKAAAERPDTNGRERFLHADLHAGNVMLPQIDEGKVIDFGYMQTKPLEFAFRQMAFMRHPLLRGTVDGYEERSGKELSRPLLAYYAITHVLGPEPNFSGDRLMSAVHNVAANLDDLAAHPSKRELVARGDFFHQLIATALIDDPRRGKTADFSAPHAEPV